ncbi:hypothetical protein BDN70DRAFT_877136, partial [Pholiota conissans]
MASLPKHQDIILLLENPTQSYAYFTILALETSLLKDPDDRRVIFARILGYLILYGHSSFARQVVVHEVLSCEDEGTPLDAGKFYYILALVSQTTGSFSTQSSSSSSDIWEDSDGVLPEDPVEFPQSHSDAKQNALIRDPFRCIVIGIYDLTSVRKSLDLEKKSSNGSAIG